MRVYLKELLYLNRSGVEYAPSALLMCLISTANTAGGEGSIGTDAGETACVCTEGCCVWSLVCLDLGLILASAGEDRWVEWG